MVEGPAPPPATALWLARLALASPFVLSGVTKAALSTRAHAA